LWTSAVTYAKYSGKNRKIYISYIPHGEARKNCKLTPWSRVLTEYLIVVQLVKKIPAFYETQNSVSRFTTALPWSLFTAR